MTAYPGTVLLVTHDRHLIRNVADAVIEVRDGKASRCIAGVPDEVLTPADPSKFGSAKLVPNKSSNPRTQRRRETAQARQATAELRKQVSRLERNLAKADAVVADLEMRLADPKICDDPEELQRLAALYDEASAQATTLMQDWTEAAEQLETVD